MTLQPVLSDGTLSTLGNWRKIAAVIGGDPNPATEWLDEKIASGDENEPVIADERQMLYVIATLITKDKIGYNP